MTLPNDTATFRRGALWGVVTVAAFAGGGRLLDLLIDSGVHAALAMGVVVLAVASIDLVAWRLLAPRRRDRQP